MTRARPLVFVSAAIATALWLAAAFTVAALCTPRTRPLVFLSFPVCHLWFMTQRPARFPRWVFPLVPFVAVAGVGAVGTILALSTTAMGRSSTRLTYLFRSTATLVVIAVFWPPVSAGAMAVSRGITSPTHARVESWLVQQAPAGSVVVVPEINFGRPTLKRLGFVEPFRAEPSFGGSLGYDYEVYAVPQLPGADGLPGLPR